MSRRKVAIVGIGQTYHRSKRPDVNIAELCAEAARAAIEDAQIAPKDIEAFVTGNMELFEGRYCQDVWESDFIGGANKAGIRVNTGGSTGGSLANVAFEYAASGVSDLVMAIGFEKQSEGDTRAGLRTASDPIWNRWRSLGAIGIFGLIAQSYMRETGAPEEIGSMVRLRLDRHACRNPYAHLRLGFKSLEDVLNNPYLIPPLRRSDLCPTSEGACAIIVASEEKAKKMARKAVWVEDWVTIHREWAAAEELDLKSMSMAASKIFKRNGITRPMEDISVAELYTPATWAELVWLEQYGFCEPGQAWKLEEKGHFYFDSRFPVNPSGGVVATNCIGATGLIRVAEAALQLRGDAGEHQITRKPTLGFATSYGGTHWTVAQLLSATKD